MKDVPDIAVWTHRWSPLLVRCVESVARRTRGSYNLIVVCEPGNCHRNMNRVLARSRSRYLVFLDEDVEILDDSWLDRLLEDLRDHDGLGVVGCREIKDPFARALYLDRPDLVLAAPPAPLDFVSWIPAYCMCLDRGRFPTLSFDERIPGDKGMTDVDACLQLRSHGLSVARDNRFAVYHPAKSASERMRCAAREFEWFRAQRDYMTSKWGDLYAADPSLSPPRGAVAQG
ncbi:MAG: glycosyltransferase [Planctomycetota bacterium]